MLGAVLVAATLAAATVAGCSGDDEETTGNSATTGVEQAEPDAIDAGRAEVVDLDDLLVRKLEIAGQPDWMVGAFGSLWIKEDAGPVRRVDPRSGEEFARIQPPTFGEPACQGLGASSDAIWVCPRGGGRLVRIDPRSNSVAATVRIDKLANQGRLVEAAGKLWVLTGAGDQLRGIEGDSTVSSPIRLPGPCQDLAVDAEGMLLAACPQEDLLLRVDPDSGEVATEAELPGATSVTVRDDVWAAFDDGLAQLDPQTLETTAVYDVYPSYGGAIYATSDSVWVREEQGTFLTEIDPARQEIVRRIKASAYPSGGDVVAFDEYVWTTASDDSVALQLRIAGG